MMYYKLFNTYYHPLSGGMCEKLTTYKHSFGVQQLLVDLVDIPKEATEITKLQYDRIKKIIVAKICEMNLLKSQTELL